MSVANTYVWCLLVLLQIQYCVGLALSKLPPHAGYHGTGANPLKQFFEGWYLRLTTQSQGSIALIFHVFDEHTSRQSSRQGVGMQVITPSGSTFVESSDLSMFRGDAHNLEIRNYFPSTQDYFRLTENRVSGRTSTGQGPIMADFDIDLFPKVGWGGSGDSRQYSTAGWLAAFPIFEPHYQVLISKGTAMGSMTVTSSADGKKVEYDFTDATIYLEKNWGGSFPSRWWWIQCNTFESDLCVTSTGAERRLPLLNQQEEVALVALHWNGEFLPFPTVDWEVEWGKWKVSGEYDQYSVQLEGTCRDIGLPVKCPTDSGMEEIALETFKGELRVVLFKNGVKVLDEYSIEACLEVGGLPWSSRNWAGTSEMKEPLKSVVMNVDLERRASDILQLASAFVEIPGL